MSRAGAVLDSPRTVPTGPTPRRQPGRAARWRRSWRVAFRVATREARRHRGRSLLVVALVALPLTALAAYDVLAHTADLSPDQMATRALGASDIRANVVSAGPIRQVGPSEWEPDPYPEATTDDVRPFLPAGARAIAYGGETPKLRFKAGDRVVTAGVHVLPLADPLTAGMAVVLDGAAARPGEVALSPGLRETLGLRIGDRVELPDQKRVVTVSGIVGMPGESDDRYAVGPEESFPGVGFERRWLVDLPAGTTPEEARRALNAKGVLVTTRDETTGESEDDDATESLVLAVVPATMALAEVVLLAGAAFAVGARRQRRDLGLFGAAGADRAQLRRIVLASGVLLGGAGGLLGAAAGTVLAALVRDPLDGYYRYLLGPLDVRPTDLVLLVVLAVGTALLSAALPARTAARQPVTDALAARSGIRRGRRWPVFLGLPVAVAGVVTTLVPGKLTTAGDFLVVAAGAEVAQIGLLLCIPALVGAAGALGRRLPLSSRLALRDAARNRGRTTPAVAAVTAAVATAVAAIVIGVGIDAAERRQYVPSWPSGTVEVTVTDNRITPDVVARVAAELPVAQTVVRSTPEEAGWSVARPGCLPSPQPSFGCGSPERPTQVVVGDASLLRLILGRTDARAEATLAAGGLVAFDAAVVDDGRSTLWWRDETGGHDARLPAVVVAIPEERRYSGRTEAAVAGPRAAERLGIRVEPTGYVLTTTRMPTDEEEARANTIFADAGITGGAYVERGYRNDGMVTALWFLLGAVALVTLGAVAVATALALAESQAYLETLHAVGAAPSVRRRLSGWQAATICLFGTALGTAAGLVPAVAVLRGGGGVPYDIVFPALAGIVLGLPALAWLGAALGTRSTRWVAYRPS